MHWKCCIASKSIEFVAGSSGIRREHSEEEIENNIRVAKLLSEFFAPSISSPLPPPLRAEFSVSSTPTSGGPKDAIITRDLHGVYRVHVIGIDGSIVFARINFGVTVY